MADQEVPEAATTGAAEPTTSSERDAPRPLAPRRRFRHVTAIITVTATWLRTSRLGMVVMAVLIGAGAGLGAVGFRWLIFGAGGGVGGGRHLGHLQRSPHGVFFGFELILREFSIDALFPLILAAVVADLIGRGFFGSGPIFAQMPHSLVLPHDPDYLLVVVLGLAAAFIGVGFKTVLYAIEDVCDRVWKGRPEWCNRCY